MSLFPLPKNVGKSIDALRRNFLWQGNMQRRGFPLVKWETLYISKKQDGTALDWRYLNEGQKLRGTVIRAKYRKECFWETRAVKTPIVCENPLEN